MTGKGETKRAKAPRRPMRGALLLLAVMLFASAGLRLSTGPAQAIAREITALQSEGAGLPDGCAPAPDLAAVLDALKAREATVAEKEATLASREAAVSEAEGAIRDSLAALESAETDLSRKIATSQTAAEDDLGRLTTVYETMKPKEAAPLFEKMDPDFAAGFVARMKPEAAAALMAGLTPEAAYTISVVLAGRNAKAPSQ